MKSFEGRVVKAVASRFFVDDGNSITVCLARKKVTNDLRIFVGDRVVVQKDGSSFVIEQVLPRKNCLIRPYVSNIDVCFIVVASLPEVDWMLVDKVIVNCLQQQIEPVLVTNKCDLASVECSEYVGVLPIIHASALTGEGLEEIVKISKGKTVCFAGQSAVGKSSLLNAILQSDLLETGDLAKRIARGKNTTRKIQMFEVDGSYFVDTCGFSMLETIDVQPSELRLYYDDFEVYRPKCRFNTCLHLDEPDCAVKSEVGKSIGTGRYQRYVAICEEIAKRKENKY